MFNVCYRLAIEHGVTILFGCLRGSSEATDRFGAAHPDVRALRECSMDSHVEISAASCHFRSRSMGKETNDFHNRHMAESA